MKLDEINIFFDAKNGQMHGKYTHAQNPNSPAVLIVAPDPRKGATIENNVLRATQKVFVDNGFFALRVNYQGVGLSNGSVVKDKDKIVSNCLDDISAAMSWLQNKAPNASHYWIAGYSFGVYIAFHLIMRRPNIENAIIISPLMSVPGTEYDYSLSFLSPSLKNTLIIHGENDTTVNITKSEALQHTLQERGGENIILESVPGASHFYETKQAIEMMSEKCSEYINISLSTRIAKPVRKKRRKRNKREEVLFHKDD